MEKKVHQCIDLWKDKGYVDMGKDIQKMTLDVLATCIFGRDFDSLHGNLAGPLAAYNYSIENMFAPKRVIIPYYAKLPLPSNIKLRNCVNEFDDYCWSIIKDAKNEETKVPKGESENSDDPKQPSSLIRLMIDAGMEDQIIRDNVGVFFLAGHETTSASLQWTIAMLASHPEIQEKARKEVFEKVPKELTFESLKDLEYIDWIVHETMRLYPAAPVIGGRQLQTETIIGDWKVPEKIIIQLDLISNLQDPQIWGDPSNYRPERWSSDVLTKEQRSAWIPFSYGPRICIGMNFSLVEQKIFIATLLREFSKIELEKGYALQVKSGFINSPDSKKMKIKFEK